MPSETLSRRPLADPAPTQRRDSSRPGCPLQGRPRQNPSVDWGRGGELSAINTASAQHAAKPRYVVTLLEAAERF